MSMRINHNIGSISTHRNLQEAQHKWTKTLEKLSSGLKVNRAADGPAKLVISEQMRAQIAGLNQAIDNSETAVSLVQTTEANMSEINNLLISIRQLAIHASNEGVNDEVMLEADQREIDNALETINRIAQQAQFGTRKLLDGSNGATGSVTGANLEFLSATMETGDSREHGFDVKITQAATQSTTSGTTALTDEVVNQGETITIFENGKMVGYTAKEDDTAETMIKNLNNEIARHGLNVTISLGEGNIVTATHDEYGSDHRFQVSSTTAGIMSKEAGVIETTEAGLNVRGTINGEAAYGNGQVLTGAKGAKCVDGLSIRYTGGAHTGFPQECVIADLEDPDAATNEKPALEIPDGGVSVGRVFVAQNSMRFQIGANQSQTVGISIRSANPENLAKGIANVSGFKSLADVNVKTFQGAQDTLSLVDAAINAVSADRGVLGAFQKNTLESNLANLRIQNENLISSESVIRDVDMAQEMAEFTKNQIRTQSATAMLAQANQLPSIVLSLLG